MIPPYAALMVVGLIFGLMFWLRLSRRDPSTVGLYVAALAGAFFGAKLSYLACEGWMYWGQADVWRQWATGKSILGALIGGYLSVEGVKRLAVITTITGDWFASFVPLAIALGRLGCLSQGCCGGRIVQLPGTPAFVWPTVPVEFAFNVTAATVFWILRRRNILPGQHFHLFMMAYGVFRLLHEPLRSTPKVFGPWSLYQSLAGALVVLGFWGFRRRSHFSRHEARRA